MSRHKRSTTIFLGGLALLWMLMIFISSAQPATKSKELSNGVTKVLIETVEKIAPNKTGEVDLSRLNHFVRKNAHFFSYLVLGILVLSVLRRSGLRGTKGVFIAFAICVVYAISDEVHQAFVPGRGPQVRDVFIDSAGAITGIGLRLGFGRIKKQKGRHTSG